MAHAPASEFAKRWTTYTYDGIGRTLSVATVGSEHAGNQHLRLFTYAFLTASTRLRPILTGTTKSGTACLHDLIAVSEPANG